jgi:hypothetical protein
MVIDVLYDVAVESGAAVIGVRGPFVVFGSIVKGALPGTDSSVKLMLYGIPSMFYLILDIVYLWSAVQYHFTLDDSKDYSWVHNLAMGLHFCNPSLGNIVVRI